MFLGSKTITKIHSETFFTIMIIITSFMQQVKIIKDKLNALINLKEDQNYKDNEENKNI